MKTSSKMKFVSNNKANSINTARRRNDILRKISLLSKVSAFLLIVVFCFTTIFDGFKARSRERICNFTSNYLGFTLSKILIEGQENITTEEVLKVVDTKISSPMLSIDIKKIQKNLEQNDWVKRAIVERRFPDKIYIGIVERKPIVKWQYNQKIMLIDDEAVIIKTKSKEDYSNLILVVGQDAYMHANDLLDSTKTHPELFKLIEAAIRYGERRWDLKFKGNLTAKMPETNFDQAWNYLSKLHKANKLFTQNISIIDLRDREKYYITRSNSLK